MRIYYGRIPEGDVSFIDSYFPQHLARCDYHLENAVEAMVAELEEGRVYHTLNPLIPNYMDDDVGSELMWMIDEEGNHVHMKDDSHMMFKLTFMGVGEVLCDDYRSFKGE